MSCYKGVTNAPCQGSSSSSALKIEVGIAVACIGGTLLMIFCACFLSYRRRRARALLMAQLIHRRVNDAHLADGGADPFAPVLIPLQDFALPAYTVADENAPPAYDAEVTEVPPPYGQSETIV